MEADLIFMSFTDHGLQANDTKVGSYTKNDKALLWINDTQSNHTVVNPQNDLQCLNDFFSCNSTVRNNSTLFSIVNDSYANTRHFASKDYYHIKAYELFKMFLTQLGYMHDVVSAVAQKDYYSYKTNFDHLVPMKPFGKSEHPSGPCVPGTARLFIDVNGNFFPCERVSELSGIMNIGNLEEGFRTEHIRKLLNIGQTTEEECKHCRAFRQCTACLVMSDDIDHLSRELRLTHCRTIKREFDETIKNYVMMYEAKSLYQKIV